MNTYVRHNAALALFLVLILLPLEVFAQGEETIRVRAGIHDTYGRVVFDWTRRVDYRVDRDGGTVTLQFNAPARADLSNVARIAPPQFRGARQVSNGGDLAVTFAINPNARIRHFFSGTKVVLDVLNTTTSVQAPAQRPSPQVTTPRPAPVQAPPRPPVAAAPSAPQERPDPVPARVDPPDPPVATPPPTAPPVIRLPVRPQEPPVAVDTDLSDTILRATGQFLAPAAAFVRDRRVWLVLASRDEPVDFEMVGAPIPDIERLDVDGGVAFVFRLPDGLFPVVTRDGPTWAMVLSSNASIPVGRSRLSPRLADRGGIRLVADLADVGDILNVVDPMVGDRLLIATSITAGESVVERRRFPELEILPAIQGLVARPIADNVTMTGNETGVSIDKSGGLAATGPAQLRQRSDVDGIQPFEFPFARWLGADGMDFIERRQALTRAATQSDEDEKNIAVVELAGFDFANGLGAEAIGIMDVALERTPSLRSDELGRAIQGAVEALGGDIDIAFEALSEPRYENSADAALWLGYAHWRDGDMASAAQAFEKGLPRLNDHPTVLFGRLATAMGEAGLETDNLTLAQNAVDRLAARIEADGIRAFRGVDPRPKLAYLDGAHRLRAGNAEGAAEAWREAADSPDRRYSAMARLGLASLALASEDVSQEEAIESLERLRFAWRGDAFELEVLRELADHYFEAGRYRDGFDTLRLAATYFPDGPEAAEITEAMTDRFAGLYIGGDAEDMSAVDALALYDDFKELTPAGPRGDQLIQRLAERLFEIDLLDQAADLLEQQVEFRLSGRERADVGARLAAILLLDGQSIRARDALNLSEAQYDDRDLALDRRLLRARALSEMGQTDEALGLIANSSALEAVRLRVDVAWRGQRWQDAATALGTLVPPPIDGVGLETEDAQLVVNQVVAWVLAGDRAAVDRVRDLYGPAMAETAQADAFALLTRPLAEGGLPDLRTIQAQVAEVDLFRSVLTDLRAGPGA